MLAMKIALCGPPGAGKSTVAENLEKNYGFGQIATGTVVREVSRALFGTEDRSKLALVGRTLLALDPTVVLRSAIARASLSCAHVVFDSIRCDADLNYCRRNEFLIVRIVAPPASRALRLASRNQGVTTEADERSTLELFHEGVQADVEIENSKDLVTFERSIAVLLDGVRLRLSTTAPADRRAREETYTEAPRT
jgi:cytidylate kinase